MDERLCFSHPNTHPPTDWRRQRQYPKAKTHYSDVMMGAVASQITSLTIVYSTVHSGAGRRKHQSCMSLAFEYGQMCTFPVAIANTFIVTAFSFQWSDNSPFYNKRCYRGNDSGTTYPNIVNSEVIMFFGALDPFENVVGGLLGVGIRTLRVFSHPTRERPGKTVQFDCRVSLKRRKLMIYHQNIAYKSLTYQWMFSVFYVMLFN